MIGFGRRLIGTGRLILILILRIAVVLLLILLRFMILVGLLFLFLLGRHRILCTMRKHEISGFVHIVNGGFTSSMECRHGAHRLIHDEIGAMPFRTGLFQFVYDCLQDRFRHHSLRQQILCHFNQIGNRIRLILPSAAKAAGRSMMCLRPCGLWSASAFAYRPK